MTILNHDFLALTLANPNGMAPFQFTFSSGTGVVEETGILRLEPNQKSRVSVVLSAGIHGNETGPMELINQLVRDILAGKLTLGVRLLVIIGHPVAANAATRFCDVNLNRLFSGAWRNYAGIEVQRAERLEMAVNDFYALSSTDSEHIRLHYDLHTAIRGSMHEKFVVYPFVENAHYSKQQLAFFAASEIEAVLISHQPTTTFSYYSYSVHGAHAFTVELGKVYPFGQNDLSCFTALEKNLRQLLEKGCLAESSLSSLCIFNVLDALVKDDDSYELNIDQNTKNFTQFTEGYPLAQSKKSVYRVKQTGDAIVFPNTNLPVGQRAGLVVRPVSVHALSLI